jgi:hypothetical protein
MSDANDLRKLIVEALKKSEEEQAKGFTDKHGDELAELFQNLDLRNPMVQYAIADTVSQRLNIEVKMEDISRFYADVKYYKPGETPEFTFRKGVKSYVIVPGAFAPRSQFIQRKITLDTELVAANPEMELSQLESGRYGSMNDIKNEAKKELLGRRNATLWSVLYGSITSSDTANYRAIGSAPAAELVRLTLVSGLNYVEDVGGGAAAIVGRISKLGVVTEFAGYSEKYKEKVDSSGGKILGDFRGVPLVGLHQYTDGYDINRINSDNIMIVAKDTTVLAVTEKIRALPAIDADTRMWNCNFTEKYGGLVKFPSYNWRIYYG